MIDSGSRRQRFRLQGSERKYSDLEADQEMDSASRIEGPREFGVAIFD